MSIRMILPLALGVSLILVGQEVATATSQSTSSKGFSKDPVAVDQWTPFTAQFTISTQVEKTLEEVQGIFYRRADGSSRREMEAPKATRLMINDPDLVLIEIRNAEDRAAYWRGLKSKWFRHPLSEARYREAFRIVPPGSEHTVREGVRDQFTLYRSTQNGGKNIDWHAEELNFFSIKSIHGSVRTTYHHIELGDPKTDFRPPANVQVETVTDEAELFKKLMGRGGPPLR